MCVHKLVFEKVGENITFSVHVVNGNNGDGDCCVWCVCVCCIHKGICC